MFGATLGQITTQADSLQESLVASVGPALVGAAVVVAAAGAVLRAVVRFFRRSI